jgi:hypothetical protein
MTMWRQGDVLISSVDSIPGGATRRPDGVLAEGEATGHSHRIEQPTAAELLEHRGQLYLRVVAGQVQIVHQEHGPITLPRGQYRVWKQREYTPQAIRPVRD